jgi:signal transduction histidine kinase
MKSWARHSLQTKFLILTIPLVLLVNLAFFATYEFIEIRSQRVALKKKQESMTASQTIILAGPVAAGDTVQITLTLAVALADSDFVAAVVHDDTGRELASFGASIADTDPEYRVSQPINHASHIGFRTVGKLTTVTSDERLWAGFFRRATVMIGLLVLVSAGLILGVHVALRATIIRPVRELISAIESAEVGGVRREVNWNSFDEIGRVIDAYNRLERNRERYEEELNETRRELENRVKARTIELQVAHDQANAANQAKSRFLANVSHELRTPLNAILGFADLIANEQFGPINDQRYWVYSEFISRSGQHLLTLINDILDLSKAEAGQLQLHEELVDLAGVTEDAIRMVRQRADSEHIELSVGDMKNAPVMRADRRMMVQILLNLASNAVKFTPSGGRVAVSWTVREDEVRLSVSDTGIGIPPEDIPMLMEPFTQRDGDLARGFEGTGLGLPLTKHLAELHGGRLEIEAAEGGGTRVTVTLPASRIVDLDAVASF